VFEELHALDATSNGMTTKVINNNGPADLEILMGNGRIVGGQAKTGYKTAKAGFDSSPCPVAVVDKGNTKLIKEAQDAGKTVIESNVSDQTASRLAKAMKTESKITGKKNASLVSKTVGASKSLKQVHRAGSKCAGKGAAAGAGLSIGTNIVNVISGDKEFEDAAVDIAKDTATATAAGYAIGAGASAVGSTAAGAALASGLSTAGTAATAAMASTSGGAAVLGAAATASAATATGAAAVSTATAGLLGAAATTTIGAAAVAAAPVLVAGAAIGAIGAGIGKLFGR
jgi:hypothetical protein